MKKILAGIMAATVLVSAVGLAAEPEARASTVSVAGTWELVSFKYGTNETAFTQMPPGQRRIKMITDTHFTWVQVDTATKKVTASAGGPYSLNGSTYTESIEFGLEMDSYMGQKQAFSVRVEGDKLFQSGALSDGLKLEEVWRRVKL